MFDDANLSVRKVTWCNEILRKENAHEIRALGELWEIIIYWNLSKGTYQGNDFNEPWLLNLPIVNYKSALAKITARDWTRVFAVCLCGDWTLYCCACWSSTPLEGVQGGDRHSVLQRIWWDRYLDSWIFSETDFMIPTGKPDRLQSMG